MAAVVLARNELVRAALQINSFTPMIASCTEPIVCNIMSLILQNEGKFEKRTSFLSIISYFLTSKVFLGKYISKFLGHRVFNPL